jgi:putative IMPACT (imprinted ancient) family translation regulator
MQQRAVNEQVIAMLEHLVDDARSREDADRRMVANLSKHVLDRVAVVDHLYFIVAELETRLRKFEAGK